MHLPPSCGLPTYSGRQSSQWSPYSKTQSTQHTLSSQWSRYSTKQSSQWSPYSTKQSSHYTQSSQWSPYSITQSSQYTQSSQWSPCSSTSSPSSLFGMHHQCVAPLATNSLHSGLFRASSIASSKVRLSQARSFFKVAIQEV